MTVLFIMILPERRWGWRSWWNTNAVYPVPVQSIFLISADQCLSEDGQIGIDGQIFYVQNQREEHKHMREKVDLSEMVECHYKGAITYIPVQLFISMSMRVKFAGKKFIRYKDATQMYGMSLSTLKRFLQDTDVVYHPTDGVALINVEKMDALLEYYQGER